MLTDRLLNLIKIGTLSAASDESGAMALHQVQHNDIETHGQIQHLQPFGFVSVPHLGAKAVTLALNHDHSSKIVLAAFDPTVRPRNMKAGETQLHDATGQSVYLAQGGVVSVAAGSEVKVIIGGNVVFDLTASACTISVPLTVNGSITASGDVVGNGKSLDTHVHTAVQSGSSKSGPPA